MLRIFACAAVTISLALLSPRAASRAAEPGETIEQKCVVSIERIWDRPDHSAFTDVILHNGSLYCTFREGSGHIPGLNGVVRSAALARPNELGVRGAH